MSSSSTASHSTFGLLKQALPCEPINDIENDTISERPASSAAEYLMQVRMERNSLPSVKRAIIKKSKIKPQTFSISNIMQSLMIEKKTNESNENKYEPDSKWRQIFANSFKEKRDELLSSPMIANRDWNEENVNEFYDHEQYCTAFQCLLNNNSIKIPFYKNRNQWLAFALNYKTNNKKMKNKYLPIPPFLSLLNNLSPISIEFICEHLMSHAINNNMLSINCSVWLYALFMRLEMPFHADFTSNLRQFARFCVGLREEIQDEIESDDVLLKIMPFLVNIFIVIVEDVFCQPL